MGWHDGHHQGYVRQMSAAGVGIVEHGDVARREFEGFQGCRNGHGHGAQMNRHVVAHRRHAALAVKHCTGIIPAFLDIRRKGRAAQRRPHLLSHRVEEVLENLEFCCVDAGHSEQAFLSLVRGGRL